MDHPGCGQAGNSVEFGLLQKGGRMTKIGKYLAILRLELEDSMNDFAVMLRCCRDDAEQQRISDYVGKENEVILRQEMSGLQACIESIRTIDPASFASVGEAEEAILALFRKTIDLHGYPQALLVCIKEILTRVNDFVQKRNM
jgi:hypothetical protein